MQPCEECTLCCKMCKIESMDSLQGDYCKKCVPGSGCLIYGEHPDQCKTFMCAYYQMEKVNPDLRPDRCGVVFEKVSNNVMVGSVDGRIEDISALVRGQVEAFGAEGFSVFLQQFNPYKYKCWMVQGTSKEEIIKVLEDKTHDSTKLH